MNENPSAQVGADDVDPEIRYFLDEIARDYAAEADGTEQHDIVRRRALAERLRERWRAGGPDMARTDEARVGPSNVRIRIHRPIEGHDLPVLVYIHGGGWALFSIDTHDRLMREYAHRASVAVVGVDYSLAPEVRFPHALHEISEVMDWLRGKDAAAFGLDGSRIAIGGDSAGANLSLATALLARDAGRPMPDALVLNYGAFDDTVRNSHYRYDGDRYMLTRPEMVEFWDLYLDGKRPDDPLARPLRADMTGLPPTFLCIAPCDILADENRALASRMADAGVSVTAREYPGATHSFLEAMSVSSLANRAIEETANWLGKQLAV